MKLSECLRRLVTDAIGLPFSGPTTVAGVEATNNTGGQEPVQRTGSGTSQDSDDGKVGS